MELSCCNIKKFLYFLKGKLLLYFGKQNPALPSLNTKKSTRKKFLVFPEMELSSSNIKKILILSQKKAFLIFLETKPCTFHPKLEK